MPDPVNGDFPLSFGIHADTGQPLPPLRRSEFATLLGDRSVALPNASALERRAATADSASYAVIGDIDDPNDLAQTGWGVILGGDVPTAVENALEPLFAHRRSQVDGSPYKVYRGADAPRPGETAEKWLVRHGASLQVVDPALGVPFYLLIVGSPEAIPFEFQYGLDIYFAAGRVYFDTADEYRRYAESVVAYDRAAVTPTTRRAALFATTHDFDQATQLFTSRVARPLVDGLPNQPVLGAKQKYALDSFVGDTATKQALAGIFSGAGSGGRPSLLFSGTHGMAFGKDDPRLPGAQGAIVCQDWSGFGRIEEKDWFAGSDVPSTAQVHGLIHVLFACYGAGWPKFDNFQRAKGAPMQIAPGPMIGRLPQALLAHPNGGALAVIGHVERAWGYSFVSSKGGAQTQGFRDVLGRLLRGERAGQAMDQFNVRWAALSTELSEALDTLAHGGSVSDVELANRWVARDDARNYIVFGDPAVRLRVEDMPEI